MKNLTKICLIVFVLFLSTESFGQFNSSIQSNNYEWHFKKDCWAKNSQLEVFKVIETPPLILDVNQKQFKSEIKDIIKTNFNNIEEELEFKIQVCTIVNQGVCIGGILVKEGTSENLSRMIFDYISRFDFIEFGKQRGEVKNCFSEVYIRTNKNKLKDLRFSNLKFRQ